MKSIFLIFFLFTLTVHCHCSAQTKFLVAAGMDLIKTDMDQPFQKYQGGLEVDYFLKQKLSISLGYEMWSEHPNYLAIGSRIYFLSFVFVKPRVLFNSDDINGSISIGYNYFLNRRWRWESNIDVYTDMPELAIRTGFTYVFTK